MTNKQKKNSRLYTLKNMALIAWHKANKQISCKDCGEVPTEFQWGNFWSYSRGPRKLKKISLPRPKGFAMHLLNKYARRINFLKDVLWRCEICNKKYHELSCEKDHGHIKFLTAQHKMGGDVFNTGVLYGGNWGNGK